MKIGFLYGGQGSQRAGMGQDFYNHHAQAKAIYDGFSQKEQLQQLSFHTEQSILNETQNTQPAIVAYEVMVTDLLLADGIVPHGVCGLSIGEYAALYAAEVIDQKAALSIAFYRGKIMAEATPNQPTGMYAIIGATESEVKALIAAHQQEKVPVYIANINAAEQIVISGATTTLKDIVAAAKAAGHRALPLKVSGPFHTPYMQAASQQLARFLSDIPFKDSALPIYFNVTGQKAKDEDAKSLMVEQMYCSVRLDDCLRHMLADGIDTFIEIGTQSVLAKLLKKLDIRCKVHTIATYDDYLKVQEFIHGT